MNCHVSCKTSALCSIYINPELTDKMTWRSSDWWQISTKGPSELQDLCALHHRFIPVLYSSAVVGESVWRQGERKSEEEVKTLPSFQSKRMLRCYSGCQWQADTLPTHITQNALFSSVSLSFFLHHLFCVLHQYRTSRLHNRVSLLPPEIFSTPS